MQTDLLSKVRQSSPITGKISQIKRQHIPSFQESIQSKENANYQNSLANVLSSDSFHSFSEKKSYLQKNPKTNLIDFVSPSKLKGNQTTKQLNQNVCTGFEGYVSSMPTLTKQQEKAGSIASLDDIPEQSPVIKNKSRKISVFNPQRANTQEYNDLPKALQISNQTKNPLEQNLRSKFKTLKVNTNTPTASLQMIDSFVHTPTLNKIIDEDGNEQINQYIVIKKLGQGAFGKVKLAKDKETEEKFAIKISNKKKLQKKAFGLKGETAYNKLQKEIAIMKSLCHPNIVNLYEVIDDPEQNKLYLIMEYVQKGSIFSKAFNLSLMEKNKDRALNEGLTEDQAKKYFAQLALGIDYLHNHANVIHRDIKPDNILIDENDNVKIADFGISELLEQNDNENKHITNASGTKVFLAPELWHIGKISCEGKPLDIWAAGVTLFYMIFRKYPYFSRDVSELQQKILYSEIDYPHKISNELIDLFQKCLNKDPQKRISANQILKHDWLTNHGEIELNNDFSEQFLITENKIEEALTILKKQ